MTSLDTSVWYFGIEHHYNWFLTNLRDTRTKFYHLFFVRPITKIELYEDLLRCNIFHQKKCEFITL